MKKRQGIPGKSKGSKKKQKWIRVGHRRPGRPKGSKNRKKEDLSQVKIVKCLGHCEKCEVAIIVSDCISKCIYICPSCHHRGRVSGLKVELNRERPTSKKEYMENNRNIQHIDSPPLLKIIEEMPGVEIIEEE